MASISFSIFIIGTLVLLCSTENSFAFSRPAESAISFLFLSGISLLITGFVTSILSRRKSSHLQSEYIPLSDSLLDIQPHLPPSLPSDALEKLRKVTSAKTRRTWLVFLSVVSMLCIRVEVFRNSIKRSHCSFLNGLSFVPLILAVYEYFFIKKKPPVNVRIPDVAIKKHLNHVLAATLLLVASLLLTLLKSGWESTFICPLSGHDARFSLFFQLLGVVIDVGIALAIKTLANCDIQIASNGTLQTPTLWGCALLVTSLVWAAIEILRLNVPINNRTWNFAPLSWPYAEQTFKQSILGAVICVSAFKAISQVSILSLYFIFTAISVYLSLLFYIWTTPFPAMDVAKAFLATLLTHGAVYLYCRPSLSPTSGGNRQPQLKGWLRLGVLVALGTCLALSLSRIEDLSYHPISLLISHAQTGHREWARSAAASTNLKQAVEEYRRRYHQLPPPGFDIWYQYATNRSSVIIDDYDQIYDDLSPFRALQPQHLRDLVLLMTGDTWNEVSSVIVRNGKPEPQPEVAPTHRWMLEGIANMIEPFAHHLPDMDIAFNINDECRVAVPWDLFQSSKIIADNQILPPNEKVTNVWSENRAQTWARKLPIGEKSHLFVDYSFRGVYDLVGRSLCPANSRAATTFIWNKESLCLTCTKPHSLDRFLQNWKLSSDICHQPDLAFLHGFFLSPSSFKVSRKLLPVFSQSKVSGFNDILYPSSWNYIDKVKYEPSNDHPDPGYFDKEPTMFWRGTTSEGLSEHGAWKGMARQRLIHLANNHTSKHVSVLLPTKQGKFAYKTFKGSEIKSSLGLNTSIFVAESVARCHGGDCDAQTREFGTVPRTDFQEHWKYRFLFDMDGAGFSGRFLPFLQSRSLPFRTALFRQWLDSRLTPWLHFVPQDLRLHDFFSTLAYFAGAKEVDETGNVKRVIMKPHDNEGMHIAEEGRKWAERAIRKEDMEIYMFRLLLEWARLTDDNRDQLGFLI